MASDPPTLPVIETVPDPKDRIPYSGGRLWRWGIAFSLALHALVAAGLYFNPDHFESAPAETQIPVVLVPPFELEAPELEAPELEPAPEEEETAPPEEPPAPPEPAEEETVPAEEPPAVTAEEAAEAQLPVLQPVVEFGETDSGAEISQDGNAAEEASDEADAEPEEAPVEQEQEQEQAEEDAESEQPVAEQSVPDQPIDEQPVAEPSAEEPEQVEREEPVPDEPEPEEPGSEEPVSDVDEASETQIEEPEILAGDIGVVGPIVTASAPTPKPEPELAPLRNPATGSGNGVAQAGDLTEAKRLFSNSLLDDPQARTAMAGMGPGRRLNLLCMTELRAQLGQGSLPYHPDILPSFRPRGGTVLDYKRVAFRSWGLWYDVAFRCQADDAITKVRKFSHRVIGPVPRHQWIDRGFPSN